jgi:hypothetical protein
MQKYRIHIFVSKASFASEWLIYAGVVFKRLHGLGLPQRSLAQLGQRREGRRHRPGFVHLAQRDFLLGKQGDY